MSDNDRQNAGLISHSAGVLSRTSTDLVRRGIELLRWDGWEQVPLDVKICPFGRLSPQGVIFSTSVEFGRGPARSPLTISLTSPWGVSPIRVALRDCKPRSAISCAFTNNGRYLLLGLSNEKALRLLDLRAPSDEDRGTVYTFQEWPHAITWSPDGRFVGTSAFRKPEHYECYFEFLSFGWDNDEIAAPSQLRNVGEITFVDVMGAKCGSVRS